MASCIGVIGGTGLDKPGLFEPAGEFFPDTPYGRPSGPLRRGRLRGSGVDIVLLERHGQGHTIPPHKVNYRANIHALKACGCSHVLASAACGSLQDAHAPGSLVLPDQFIDATRHRASTFFDRFDPGVLGHTPMADPFSPQLRGLLLDAARECAIPVHDGGTIVTIEGPRFSTRAESRMYRLLGGDLINMTIATECALANEIGLPYAVLAMVTDYDSWSEEHPPLDVDELLRVFADNVDRLVRVFVAALARFGA